MSSFPGGLHDETDEHMLSTALREAEEEIGLRGDDVDIWGQMKPVPGKVLNRIWCCFCSLKCVDKFFDFHVETCL